MMAKCAQTFEVFAAEILSATAVDDELVLASVAVHRRTKAGLEYHGTIVMTFRVEDGIVTRGTDMISSAGEAYWSSLGL
jgi:hypothetical protein